MQKIAKQQETRKTTGYTHLNYPKRDERRGESFDVMMRKFFREVQLSGILTEIKKRRFRDREISRERIRESARRKMARRKIKRGY